METLDLTFSSILAIIGYIGGVIGVIYTIRSFRENTRIKEGDFLMRKFEGFQRDRQAMLDNPRILSLLAKHKRISEDEYILRSINSFRINKAFENYYLHKKGHIEAELWERDEKDIHRLFTDPTIIKRWEKAKPFYSRDFQNYIDLYLQQTSTNKTEQK
ncbi:MAG: hypothetical protein AAF927_02290 [Bacteroidota bacterium]